MPPPILGIADHVLQASIQARIRASGKPALLAQTQDVTNHFMTLEELADLIRANSANTNGRIDSLRNETNAILMFVQNDLTDVRVDIKAVRSDVSSVRQAVDLAATISALRHEIDDSRAEIADLKRRAS